MSEVSRAYNKAIADSDQAWATLKNFQGLMIEAAAKHRNSEDVHLRVMTAATNLVVAELMFRSAKQKMLELGEDPTTL